MTNLRILTLAAGALLCAGLSVLAQEPPAKARNGGYLGIFVREGKPGHIVIERLHKGGGGENFRQASRKSVKTRIVTPSDLCRL